VTDGKGGTDTATVQISVVDPLNNPPVALDDSATTTDGVPVTVNVISGAFGGADSDPDPADLLTVKSILEQPSHGTVVIGADNSITYSPVPGYGGADQLVYLLADGEGGFDTATVSFLVFSGTAPVARDDATTININEQVTINVLEGTTGGLCPLGFASPLPLSLVPLMPPCSLAIHYHLAHSPNQAPIRIWTVMT